MPDNHSAIIIDDFKSPKELAKYLKFLDKNDDEYNKYLQWKKSGVTNTLLKDMLQKRTWDIKDTWKYGRSNFIEDFECLVCQRVHKNDDLVRQGQQPEQYRADNSALECPKPEEFAGSHNTWLDDWENHENMAQAVRYFTDRNVAVTKADMHAKLSEISYKKKKGWF